jgi:predicted phosphate transport protein (TIGR00153 family)
MLHSIEWLRKKIQRNTLECSLKHLEKVKETVEALHAALKVTNDTAELHRRLHEVASKEHEADCLRKELGIRIAKEEILFAGSDDLLEFVHEADSIADYAHAADRFLALFDGQFTAEIHAGLLHLAEIGVACVHELYRTVEDFAQRPKVEILEACSRIEGLEEQADDVKRDVLKNVLSGHYSPAQLLVLRDLTEAVEDICDMCEIAAARVRILTVRL